MATSRRWLFGPAPDLLLGCGLAWLGIFLLHGSWGDAAFAAAVPAGLIVMATSIPHYGATLLRVYESKSDRRKYALFAIHASAALAILFVVGLRSAWLGSVLVTIYLTWSPWHYTGQNYGISLMLLGRRGVAVSGAAKRWIYASFVLSYRLTFVAIHGANPEAAYAPVVYGDSAFRNLPLGIPAALCAWVVPLLLAGYVGALAGAWLLLVRAGRPRDLLPAALLTLTQALWFPVPVALRHFALVDQSSFLMNVFTTHGFLWIAGAHAVQYLWITSYFARASGSSAGLPLYLGKTVLAGYAIWTLPALLFAPNVLGRLPYESGLAMLTAAVVNLHHFILDGAIWKLRDGPIARVLLRSEPAASEALAPILPRRRLGPAIAWSAGALSLAVAVFAAVEGYFGHQRALAQSDLTRARLAAQRLAWVGRDGPSIHREIGRILARRGQADQARAAYQRSLALHPTPRAWLDLAAHEEADGRLAEALRCREEALALQPDNVEALYAAGLTSMRLGDQGRAVAHLERAADLAPEQGLIGLALERARGSEVP